MASSCEKTADGTMPKKRYRNPVPTVDVIIEAKDAEGKSGVVLIKRKNPPEGWALPGGFVDYGETLEAAAVREAAEETSLEVESLRQFHAYSDPGRDPRSHTVSTVFTGRGRGVPRAGDDASSVGIFDPEEIPVPLAFDHRRILDDYVAFRQGKDPWTTRKTRNRKTAATGTSRR
jgi:8-oxo-dGTP diphosphatase